MPPAISVIVPVYNTGDVLEATIKSVICQTFNDFELILVDDGSTDGSGRICDEFAEKDPRIKVVHKSNGGICQARNVGIELSKSKYITFCDHDDFYSPFILEKEYDTITRENVDIVVAGKTVIQGNKKTTYGLSGLYTKKDIQGNLLLLLESNVINNVWNILYRRDIVGNIRFDESLKFGQEDYKFNYCLLRSVNSIFFIKDPLYTHVVRKGLSTSSKTYKELIPALIDTNNDLYSLIEEMTEDNQISYGQYVNVQGACIHTCLIYTVKTGVNFKEFKSVAEMLRCKGKFKNHGNDKSKLKYYVAYVLFYKKHYRLLFLVYKVFACKR